MGSSSANLHNMDRCEEVHNPSGANFYIKTETDSYIYQQFFLGRNNASESGLVDSENADGSPVSPNAPGINRKAETQSDTSPASTLANAIQASLANPAPPGAIFTT